MRFQEQYINLDFLLFRTIIEKMSINYKLF